MIKRMLIITCLGCLLLSGCVQKQILDDVQLITAAGYDLIGEGKILGTALAPTHTEQEIKNNTFTGIATLSKEIRGEINSQSSKPFVSGSLEVALYSKELAQQGIIELVDSLQRDPSIGSRIYLAIVDGSAKELLEGEYGTQDNGMYLSKLMEQNINRGMLPKTNLHRFLFTFYGEGMDPILPYLEVMNGNIRVKGIALLDNDRYVDYVKDDDAFLLNVLIDKFTRNDSIDVRLNDKDEYASIYNIHSNRDYQMENQMSNPEITIHTKMESIIREYSGENLDEKTIAKIEQQLETELEKKANELIKRLQELKIDPLGIGNQVRRRSRNWDSEKWGDLYPDAKVNVQFDIQVTETGIIK
jgi:spore germination protein